MHIIVEQIKENSLRDPVGRSEREIKEWKKGRSLLSSPFSHWALFVHPVIFYHFVGHCGALCGLKWRILRGLKCILPR